MTAPRFDGRVALVTGAASGMGRATVVRLAAEGALVYAADRVLPAFEDEPRIRPVSHDVTHSADVNALLARIEREARRLHVVVTAAGVADSPSRLREGAGPDITAMTDADWAFVLDVNLSGTFFVIRASLPLLRANGRSGGSIVTISSVGALANVALSASYPASKAGVLGLTRAVAAAEGHNNIRINAVAPGAVDTPMLPVEPERRGYLAALGVLNRVATADELAATIVYLASDEAAFITGQTVSPNGGFTM